MNLQDILYVVEVARTGNFSKAAENLYVTEPTISQRIKKLEEELHLKLFTRSTRRVALTDAGEAFLEHAQPIAEHYRDLTDAMRQRSRESQKKLSIGMMTNMYAAKIPQFFREFCISHPELDVHLQTMSNQELRDSLRKGTLDYAVLKMHAELKQYFDPQQFTHTLLREEKIYVLLRPQDAPDEAHSLRLQDVAQLPVIVDREESSMYRMLESMYRDAGLEMPLSTIRTGDAETVLLGVEQGDGISFGSDSIVTYYQDRFSFAAIPLEPMEPYNVYLVSRKESHPTSFDREFIKRLRLWLKQRDVIEAK